MNGTTRNARREVEGPLAERALLFELGGRSYGLRIGAIEGLGEPGTIRCVPGAPASVLGVCEWRGRLLTVVDLPALLPAGPAGTIPADPAVEPCLVRLAAPLDGTALWVPAQVRLGWAAAEAASPGDGSAAPARPRPSAEGERDNPRFLDPRFLIRRLASAVGR